MDEIGLTGTAGIVADVTAIFRRTEDLYTRMLFAATLAFTAAAMWYGACEMISSSPLADVASLSFARNRHLPAWLSTIYLPLLGAYGGVREWMRYTQTRHDDPAMVLEAQRQTQRISRELAVVIAWLGYVFAALVAEAEGWAGTLSATTLYLAASGITVLTGAHAVHKSHTMKMKRLQQKDSIGVFNPRVAQAAGEQAAGQQTASPQTAGQQAAGPQKRVRINDEHYRQVIEYLDKTEFLNNGECRKLTGLSEGQVNTLFHELTESDTIEQIGDKKTTKYRLKRPPNSQNT